MLRARRPPARRGCTACECPLSSSTQGVSFGKGEGGPTVRAALASAAVPPLSPPAAALVAECLAFAEGYRAVFTPSARLDASLHSAEEAVAALEALDRRFAVAVGELAGAADAAAADEVSVSVIERADAAPTGEGAAVTQFTERRGKFAAGEEMARAADGPLAERLARLVALLSKAALQRRAKGEDGLNVLLTARAAAAAPPGAEVGSAGTGGGVSAVTGERECEESTTMAECVLLSPFPMIGSCVDRATRRMHEHLTPVRGELSALPSGA